MIALLPFAPFAGLGCGGGDPAAGSASPQPPGAMANDVAPTVVDLPDAAPRDSAPVDAPRLDARSDAGPYRDPSPGDGACTTPNLVCPAVDDGGSACIAVDQDENNCGACGNVCAGTSATCLAGQCACSAPGFDYCTGSGCLDVTGDINNCGACGNVCDPNQFTSCQDGMCTP